MVSIYPPSKDLSNYIECFTILSHNFINVDNKTVSARGIPMLVFPFNIPPCTTLSHGLIKPAFHESFVHEPLILTATNTFNFCTYYGDVNLAMIMLKPTGAYYLMKQTLAGCNNAGFTLKEIGLDKHFNEVQDKLWGVTDPAMAYSLIQGSLSKYFQNISIKASDFSPVFQHIFQKPHQSNISHLREKFRCSERWLEKQCMDQTGLSPKSWLRIVRFRSALNYWINNPLVSSSEVVANFDYYDLSHLNKDFKDFTGHSASQYFEIHLGAEYDLKQNEAGLSSMLQS